MEKLKRPGSSIDSRVAVLITELLNAATSFHKLHLKVTGVGAFAAHTALNELYAELPDHADSIAEQYQGASERLLTYTDVTPVSCTSVEKALEHIRSIYKMINGLQQELPYSEIINELDEVKSTLNSIKYKLLFLK